MLDRSFQKKLNNNKPNAIWFVRFEHLRLDVVDGFVFWGIAPSTLISYLSYFGVLILLLFLPVRDADVILDPRESYFLGRHNMGSALLYNGLCRVPYIL